MHIFCCVHNVLILNFSNSISIILVLSVPRNYQFHHLVALLLKKQNKQIFSFQFTYGSKGTLCQYAFSEFPNGLAINDIMKRNCRLFFLFWVLKRNPSSEWNLPLFLHERYKCVFLSQYCGSSSSISCHLCHKHGQGYSSAGGLIHLDWSNIIMNFVWHFPYSAPHPSAQASAKHRPEGYRFSIHAYAGWISVNIQQNQFGCPQGSTIWANHPGFLLLPVVKQVF